MVDINCVNCVKFWPLAITLVFSQVLLFAITIGNQKYSQLLVNNRAKAKPLLGLFSIAQSVRDRIWKLCYRKEFLRSLGILENFLSSVTFHDIWITDQPYSLYQSLLTVMINPLHPSISMLKNSPYFLYTFLKVLKKRICLTIKSFFGCWSFPYSPDLNVWVRGDLVRRK